MSRIDDINILYSVPKPNPIITAYQNLFPPCRILNVLTIEDIMAMNAIAKDKTLNAKPVQKFEMIKQIMGNRGFKKLAAGTNRLVFKYMENQSFVIKVAFDSVGLSDNINEMNNQEFLKPFCTKVYEVSPCGTVGMFERVIPIRNRKEFEIIAPEVFDIIVNHLIGKYVLSDFGSKFFMNWGVRLHMHPVILDFPYVYELDGARIYCNRPDFNSPVGYCGGEIDYDDGFNFIRCKKCGKQYLASELKLAAEHKSKNIIIETEDSRMQLIVTKGDEVIYETSGVETKNYRVDKNGRRKETPQEYRERTRYGKVKVQVVYEGETESEAVKENPNKPTEPHENNIEAKQQYDSSLFNRGYSLKDVPSLDGMYQDTKLKVTDRNGNVIIDEMKEEAERKATLETTISQDWNKSDDEEETTSEVVTEETHTEEEAKVEEQPQQQEEVVKAPEVEVAEPYVYEEPKEESEEVSPAVPVEQVDNYLELREQAEQMIDVILREDPPEEDGDNGEPSASELSEHY